MPWIAAITGIGRVLHRGLHFVEADGLLGAAAELGDVGAGDERATVADHDDTLRAVVDRLGRVRRTGLGARASSAR